MREGGKESLDPKNDAKEIICTRLRGPDPLPKGQLSGRSASAPTTPLVSSAFCLYPPRSA